MAQENKDLTDKQLAWYCDANWKAEEYQLGNSDGAWLVWWKVRKAAGKFRGVAVKGKSHAN